MWEALRQLQQEAKPKKKDFKEVQENRVSAECPYLSCQIHSIREFYSSNLQVEDVERAAKTTKFGIS
jgi:hypothetical protein